MKKIIALIIILSISLTNLAVSHAAITNPELKTSVVQIWSQESDGSWYKGSGVNISVDALILTAAHVVIDSTTNQPSEHLNICITYNEYTPPSCEYSAIVYAYDPDLDLALITPQYLLDEDGNRYGEELTNEEIEAIGLPYVDIADYEPSLGDNITIIGYPDATGSTNLALTNGVISNFDTFAMEDQIFNYSYTTDAIINPGNSGGPAYNSDEKLIGIAVAVSTEGVGGNYGYIMAGDMIYVWFLTLVDAGYINQEFVDQTFGNDFVYEEYADIDLSEVIEETESTNKTFPDVDQSHQYYNSIMYMASEQVVNGYPDGTFKPDNPINRAEMMKILVEALIDDAMTYEYSDESCFPDVPANEWFTKHVCYGKNFSWVKGYADNTFRPSQTITFAEALKITFKGFNLPYTETSEPWYKDAVSYAEMESFIPYSILDYEQQLSRGEMSDLVSRIKISTELGPEALANFLFSGIEGLNPASMELAEAQNCPQGTQIYRDETDKFEFCFTEEGLIHKSDFYGTTISFSPDPNLSEEDPLNGSISSYLSYDLDAADYIEISEVTDPQNAENFTNNNNVKGVEYDIVDGDFMSHNLMFGNQDKTKMVKINYNFAEEADIELMQTIKETFKFL